MMGNEEPHPMMENYYTVMGEGGNPKEGDPSHRNEQCYEGIMSENQTPIKL